MVKDNKLLILCFIMVAFLSGCQSIGPKDRLTPEEQASLIAKGTKITALSFKALSREVINALNAGDVQHAVGYCHLQASPLIDSLSKVHHVKISRVSDKYRNPQNKPDELDLIVIEGYKEQLAEANELKPHLEITDQEVIFYSPIIILNPVCLNCHGEPGLTAGQENVAFIKSIYPDDLATGYKLGDLRGVWKIILSPES